MKLSADEAKALILARETGAVDRVALRDIAGLGEQEARQVLTRLVRLGALTEKPVEDVFECYQLVSEFSVDRPDLNMDRPDSNTDRPDLNAAYVKLTQRIAALSTRPRKEMLLPMIVELCLLEPQSSQGLANRLKRDQSRVKKTYLKELLQQGLVTYRFPEVINHPEQAYITTDKGLRWLAEKGIKPCE